MHVAQALAAETIVRRHHSSLGWFSCSAVSSPSVPVEAHCRCCCSLQLHLSPSVPQHNPRHQSQQSVLLSMALAALPARHRYDLHRQSPEQVGKGQWVLLVLVLLVR